MSETLWYLKKCDLFEKLTPQHVQRLESCSRVRRFPGGTPVYLPADEANAVYLLATGRVKVCHLTDDGKQSILAFIDPGELFGELVLLEPGPRDEYVETIDPSTVVMIPGTELRWMMKTYADVSLGITKVIGLRRKRIERRLKQLLFLSNRQKVIHLLLELAEQYGAPADGGIDLGIRLSHQDLASIVGSTRETVTVALGKLQLEGLIRVRRQRISLLDVPRLAQVVHRPTPSFAIRRVASRDGHRQLAAGLLM